MHSYEEAQQNVRAVLMQRRKAHGVKKGSCSRPPSTNGGGEEEAMKSLDYTSETLELASHHRNWYQHEGRLVVLESVPHMSLQGVVAHPVLMEDRETIATLSPGSVVQVEESVVLDSRTLQVVHPLTDGREADEHDGQKHATIQLLKITSPFNGYIVSHLHDYPYVAKGSPLDYVSDYKDNSVQLPLTTSVDESTRNRWMWRVVYRPDGAFVRTGSELISDQICTLPYGSFCFVQEKMINDMGLSRLKIRSRVKAASLNAKEEARAVEEEGEWKEIEGWISLFM